MLRTEVAGENHVDSRALFRSLLVGWMLAGCAQGMGDIEEDTPIEFGGPGAIGGAADGFGGGGSYNGSLYSAGNRHGWTRGASIQDEYFDRVQPIFAERCVTCHGCQDAPCQLKLTSYEGIVRGSSAEDAIPKGKHGPYLLSTERVTDATSGEIDYFATEEAWRESDGNYYSVVTGGSESIMHRLLDAAAEAKPIANRSLTNVNDLVRALDSKEFLCLDREAERTDAEFARRAMPFGLESLPFEHYNTLANWLETGARGPSAEAEEWMSRPSEISEIDDWENFFNQSSPKAQLMSRYIYEHVFSHHLYFPDNAGEFYELVRSATPPGQPIDEIVTERVYDDPEDGRLTSNRDFDDVSERVYYRLRKYTAIIVQKNHIPMLLDETLRERWTDLFLRTPYTVEELPDYGSSNPFEVFDAIPGTVRARFMIESSRNFLDAMVKSDTCFGTQATYAIRDRFWIWFLDPTADPSARDPHLGFDDYDHLVPTGGTHENDYQEAFEGALRDMHPNGLSLEDLWDGEQSDRDAWVTILRHEYSSSSHYGAIAGRPESLWVLSYSNFERLYYNLVVNFRLWEGAVEKLETWQYMSRIRTEAEDLFLSLLPEPVRRTTRTDWTRDFGGIIEGSAARYVQGRMWSQGRDTAVEFPEWATSDPIAYLIDAMRERVGETVTGSDPLGYDGEVPARIRSFEHFEEALRALSHWRGEHAQFFPNLTLVRVHDGEEERLYTVLAHRGYFSHDLVISNKRARDPARDVLSAVHGVVGAYPELFIDVPLDAAGTWVEGVRRVRSQADWNALVRKHSRGRGVRVLQRTDSNFFAFFDWVHWRMVEADPYDSGVLDVSRYVWPRNFGL